MTDAPAGNIVIIEPRIRLVAFDDIQLGTQRRYLVKGLIPRVGLTVVWGPPKSGKSFWTFDVVMHVALDREYRGRRVHHGAVVYCAFEGQTGMEARCAAFAQRFLAEDRERVPFFIEPVTLDLVKDASELAGAIRLTLGDVIPVAIVLDTLNRSLRGSESSDEDMSAYVRAADMLREAFECAVIIVHHCGVDGSRPRGHTSLTGAADAQLSVNRDAAENIVVTVECAKDGPQGDSVVSRLVQIVVGVDEDGEDINSCIVLPVEASAPVLAEPRMTKNQRTLFDLLHRAGSGGLTLEEWNAKAREVGIGVNRKADLYDIRSSLMAKRLVRQSGERWHVVQ
jgi:hypothetical protein